LNVRIRHVVAFSILASSVMLVSSSSHAFTLQRMAASIDVSGLAAAAGSGVASLANEVSLAVPTHTVVPPAVELVSASTEIRLGIPEESDVDIEVADESGRVVSSARVHMPAGWQKVGFSGHDIRGRELPNGTYFYRVIVGDDVLTARVLIDR